LRPSSEHVLMETNFALNYSENSNNRSSLEKSYRSPSILNYEPISVRFSHCSTLTPSPKSTSMNTSFGFNGTLRRSSQGYTSDSYFTEEVSERVYNRNRNTVSKYTLEPFIGGLNCNVS